MLPFVNLSSDKEQEFFSDGMTEEITSALAKIPSLHVVAAPRRSSSRARTRICAPSARLLGATHLIEGSVRKDGNEVRITAQLIKADDGTHLWTESYNRELKGVFAMQEEIAQAIAASLQVPLGLKQGESLVSNRTGDTDSYQDYLRAKALVRLRGLKPLTDAAALLEQVVARDPNYAPAWAMLSLAYGVTPNYHPAWFGGSVADKRRVVEAMLPKAEAAAQRAIQLDPKNADGYVTLAIVQSQRGKMLAAEQLFSKGLELDSNNPDALHQYSQWLAEVGRLKEAFAMRQRLLTLEPLSLFNTGPPTVLWLTDRTTPRSPCSGIRLPIWSRGKITHLDSMRRAAITAKPPTPSRRFRWGHFSQGRWMRPSVFCARRPSLPLRRKASRNWDLWGSSIFTLGLPIEHLSSMKIRSKRGLCSWSRLGLACLLRPRAQDGALQDAGAQAGLVDYWRARGWPDLCRPMGADDFVCD